MSEYERIRNALTENEWFGVIFADDEGLLGRCCGNISFIRENIIALFSSGQNADIDILKIGMVILAFQTYREHHDVDSDDRLLNLETECLYLWKEWGSKDCYSHYPEFPTYEFLEEERVRLDAIIHEIFGVKDEQ